MENAWPRRHPEMTHYSTVTFRKVVSLERALAISILQLSALLTMFPAAAPTFPNTAPFLLPGSFSLLKPRQQ